jgi:hypothetical protein
VHLGVDPFLRHGLVVEAGRASPSKELRQCRTIMEKHLPFNGFLQHPGFLDEIRASGCCRNAALRQKESRLGWPGWAAGRIGRAPPRGLFRAQTVWRVPKLGKLAIVVAMPVCVEERA